MTTSHRPKIRNHVVAGRGTSILAVGLSAEDCINLSRGLASHRVEVLPVRDCREAMAALVQFQPPIVIAEHELPDGSWRDIVAFSVDVPSQPAVVVASRLADEQLWVEVLDSGAFDLLAKPLVYEEVARIIAAVCGQSMRGRFWKVACP